MIIDCSLSETETLLTRAGRGAGLSWGQAQDAGWGVTRLASAGLPALEWYAALLTIIEATPYEERRPQSVFDEAPGAIRTTWQASGTGLCPIAAGCGFADVLPLLATQSGGARLELKSVWWPALMAGLISPVAERIGIGARLQIGVAEIVMVNGALSWCGGSKALCAEQVDTMLVTVVPPGLVSRLPGEGGVQAGYTSRCAIDNDLYDHFQAYASNTYVPSTPAGRSGGADT